MVVETDGDGQELTVQVVLHKRRGTCGKLIERAVENWGWDWSVMEETPRIDDKHGAERRARTAWPANITLTRQVDAR